MRNRLLAMLFCVGTVVPGIAAASDGISAERVSADRATADDAAAQSVVTRILSRDPKLLILDVRSAEEFAAAHIARANNIPHDQIETRSGLLPADKNVEILVYCRSGKRSAAAITALRKLGYARVTQLAGGFIAWQAAGYAVESDPGR